MFYIFNPDTSLYHLMTATADVDTGYITASIEQSGITYNPGWIPASGETLIPLEFYLTYFDLEASQVNSNQYNAASMAVTRYIQRYTRNDWTGVSIPEDLMTIGSLMIRDKIEEAKKQVDQRLSQESVINYSYTVSNNFLEKNLYTKYNEELDMFRIVPFV